MKKMLLSAGAAVFALAAAGCMTTESTDAPSGYKLMEMVEKATDPKNSFAKIHTAVMTYDSKYDETKIVMHSKFPDKIRIDVYDQGCFISFGYNGKTAWKYDSQSKEGPVEITDDMVKETAFIASFMCPSVDMHEVFGEMKVEGSEKLAGFDCWKVACVTKPEYGSEKVDFLINKKDNHIMKLSFGKSADKEDVYTAYFTDYRNFEGIMLPTHINGSNSGIIFKRELKSVKWNEKLSDDQFNIPKLLK